MDDGEPINLPDVYGRTTIARWRYDSPDAHDQVHVRLGRMPPGDDRWWVDHTGTPGEGPARVYSSEAAARRGVDRIGGELASKRRPGRWVEVPPYAG